MPTLKIKMILSNEKPSSKLILENDAVKRFKMEITTWKNILLKLKEQAQLVYNLVDNNFSLYWIKQ